MAQMEFGKNTDNVPCRAIVPREMNPDNESLNVQQLHKQRMLSCVTMKFHTSLMLWSMTLHDIH